MKEQHPRASLAAAFLAAAGAFAHEPAVPPAPTGSQARTLERIPEVRDSSIGGIPVRIRMPARGRPRAVVILCHGFSRSKEDWQTRQEELAKRGFATVAMDSRCHGGRANSCDAPIVAADGKLDLYELRRQIDGTARDVSTLVDSLGTIPGMSSLPTGVAGVSMGGFVAYAATARDPRIAFAVALIASPFWEDIPKNAAVRDDSASLARFHAYAKEHSPHPALESRCPRLLWGSIGSKDVHYDGAMVVDFFRMLHDRCGDGDGIALRSYPVAHEAPEAMWNDAMEWLDSHTPRLATLPALGGLLALGLPKTTKASPAHP